MKKGIALISVMMIVMILSILGLSFLNMSGLEGILARRQIFYFKALNIAEAGLERAMWKLTKQPTWRNGWNNVNFGDGYYTVTLKNQSDGTILITSTGFFGTGVNPMAKIVSKEVKAVVKVNTTSSSSSPAISYTGGISFWDLGNFPGNYGDLGQSFTTPSYPINVSKVVMFMRKDNQNVSDIYMTIRSTSPVGPVLGTSNILPGSVIPYRNPTWLAFEFPTPVPLNPNTKYFLRISSVPPSTNPPGAQGRIQFAYKEVFPCGDDEPTYPYGEAYRYIDRNSNGSYQRLDYYDFSFQIYSAPGATVNIIRWSEEPYRNF